MIDAKSGVSGAGRAATEKTHFVAVDENVSAYGVPRHRHTPEIEQELATLGAQIEVTFTPHLLPLDQGELVSCYVTLSDGADGEWRVFMPRPTQTSRSSSWRRRPLACATCARRTSAASRSTATGARPRDRVRRDRQPVEGRRLAGGAEPQPDVRSAGGGGDHVTATRTFFRSRWVDKPAHVTELEPAGLPEGFRAAGVAAGLKPEGLDVGVLVSDRAQTVSAAHFTTNARVGAPVTVSREADIGRLRAVVANAGGCKHGRRRAWTPDGAGHAAARRGAPGDRAGPGRGGLYRRDRDRASQGAFARRRARRGRRTAATTPRRFSRAILTSDRGPKRACLQVALPQGTVTLWPRPRAPA